MQANFITEGHNAWEGKTSNDKWHGIEVHSLRKDRNKKLLHTHSRLFAQPLFCSFPAVKGWGKLLWGCLEDTPMGCWFYSFISIRLLTSILFFHSVREFFGENIHHIIPLVSPFFKEMYNNMSQAHVWKILETSSSGAKGHYLPDSRPYRGLEMQQTGSECIYSLSWSPLERRPALWDYYSSEVLRIMSYNYIVITVCQPVNHQIFVACTLSGQHCLSHCK